MAQCGLFLVLLFLIEANITSAVSTPQPEHSRNVALNKDASQSSLYGALYPAEKAVDGDTGTILYPRQQCTHTALEYEPWWKVDLGGTYVITHVRVFNRGDCCGERLRNFMVRVGHHEDIDRNEQCGGIYTETPADGATIDIRCASPISGRWVSVQIIGREEQLSLCEVQVFSSSVVSGVATSTMARTTTELMTSATREARAQDPPGFCKHEVVRTDSKQVSFSPSKRGSFSYSEERCSSSSPHDKPLATRFCRMSPGGTVVWDPPVFLTCDISLRNLSQLPRVTNETALTVATELQVITESAATLSSDDVTAVSLLLQEIVNVSATQQGGESVLTVVDNLMDVDAEVLRKSQQERRGPSRVVQTLETFADTVELTTERYTSARPAVALQAADIRPDQLDMGQGFAFALSGNGSKSLTEGILYNFTIEERVNFVQTADVAITLPANLSSMLPIDNSTGVRLSYILYNDSSLFVYNPSSLFLDKQRGLFVHSSRRVVESRIIGSRIAGYQVKNLEQPVILTFTPLQDLSADEKVKEVKCAFWDFEADDGHGAWSSEGCTYQGKESGRYTCTCNHLTNFAALFDVHGLGFERHERPLEILTYVGCVVSIMALVLTLLSFTISTKQDRRAASAHGKNQRVVLMNLCVALLAVLLIFIVGIDQTASPIGCKVVAALLHYFLLAALFWMAVEAVNIFLATVLVFGHYVSENFIPKAAAVSWGFPLLVTVSTAGPSSLYKYRTSDYCWLSRTPLTYAFLLPAGLILMFNLVMFATIMYKLVRGEIGQKKLTGAQKNKADHQWVILNLRRAFSLMALFGLTWVFGFMVINGARPISAYLFCIFNTLQGLFIFVFHCIMREDVKKWLKKISCKGKKTTSKNSWDVGRELQSVELDEILPSCNELENQDAAQVPDLVKLMKTRRLEES